MVLHRQEGGRQRGGGEGHFESPTVPSLPPASLPLAPLTADHTEPPAGARVAVPDSPKRRQANTWSGPVGPAKDSDGRAMRINGCLSLVTQLGAKILNTLRQDIYLSHNELPLAKQALSGWEAGRPISQTRQALLRAIDPHAIVTGQLL